LGRLWLKEVKVHRNWGDNILIIIFEDKTITFNTIKRVNIKSSQQPKKLDNEFHWEEGFFEQKEGELYRVILELRPIGKVMPKELYFLLEIDYKMLQPEEKNEYLVSFYEH